MYLMATVGGAGSTKRAEDYIRAGSLFSKSKIILIVFAEMVVHSNIMGQRYTSN